jgi:hypothetical protein
MSMLSASLVLTAAALGADPPRFIDMTEAVGLGAAVIAETVARLCFADLNADGFADAVMDRHRVFLNMPYPASPIGRRFIEVALDKTRLSKPQAGTVTSFADLDNDGHLDAIVAEFIDAQNEKWVDHGQRTGWHRGRGDGTFEARQPLPTPPRTTMSNAAADVNRDGWLDLYFGNSYVLYGHGLEAFPNDLLLSDGKGSWARQPLPDEGKPFEPEKDLGGRPSYGTMILENPLGAGPMLLDLNYGRRWNRAWIQDREGKWIDVAMIAAIAGDAIRHGQYPRWEKELAATDSRYPSVDEKPFRSNGNTFDAAVGDIDTDGDFDLFLAEITHAWAGESSDRSRFLINDTLRDGARRFFYRGKYSVDRIPPEPSPGAPQQWNQGDLFCELADLDQDGRLDLLLSSGDYPDNQRLRVFLQQPDGTLRDSTSALGIDHDGSQQISLADADGDGDLDLLAGQTFNRYSPEQIAGRSPRPRLFINHATSGQRSLMLRLRGDGKLVNRDAVGAIVTGLAGEPGKMRSLLRQVVGPGGHAGKQNDWTIHMGLGAIDHIADLRIIWPGQVAPQAFQHVPAGRYELTSGGALRRLDGGAAATAPQ